MLFVAEEEIDFFEVLIVEGLFMIVLVPVFIIRTLIWSWQTDAAKRELIRILEAQEIPKA